MRWKQSKKQEKLSNLFRDDHIEEVDKFLYLPLRVNGQWRWLEKVTVERMPWVGGSIFGNRYFWVYIKYID